uniref:HNH endonuclease n=1 Tax=Alistipes sp. D31t1_170403_E11 TaxID=2787128 RepID=UPI00189BFC6C|nr:NUMOD4 domain-containing protein [Alistipes sp. D31t1_170403_E11]
MTDAPERWRDIRGFEGYYQVSDRGRVRSLERYIIRNGTTVLQEERILSPWRGYTSLYHCVRLYKDGNRKKYSVHRLVAEHFLPNWTPTLEVNHIDGNRDNNDVHNLEMCTHQENVRHSIIHLLKNDYGEKSANAKLTNAQAREIRTRYHSGQSTQAALAAQYDVSSQTVSAIIRYKKYIR